ncbi:MAG: GGDEF domain-containing protein, partial [Psychromonas sp.]
RLKNCIYGKDTLGRFVKEQFIIIIDELARDTMQVRSRIK